MTQGVAKLYNCMCAAREQVRMLYIFLSVFRNGLIWQNVNLPGGANYQ